MRGASGGRGPAGVRWPRTPCRVRPLNGVRGLRPRPPEALVLLLLLAACSGSGSSPSPVAGGGGTPSTPETPASVFARPAAESLSVADVEGVIARAAAEASARRQPAVIAVVDRVGNVLAVFSMAGARATAVTRAGNEGNTDVQGVTVPAAAAAIA